VWLATGHGRDGVLLAPLTAEFVAGALAGDSPDDLLSLCDPGRFVAA
jgi:glycine/D-amino acid oxidase-like deaminating enzyme